MIGLSLHRCLMKDCKGTNASTDRLEGAYIRDRSLFFSVCKIQTSVIVEFGESLVQQKWFDLCSFLYLYIARIDCLISIDRGLTVDYSPCSVKEQSPSLTTTSTTNVVLRPLRLSIWAKRTGKASTIRGSLAPRKSPLANPSSPSA